MYAKIAMLLLVAASAAACARNDQLACREFQTESSVKGPGCALDIAESQGEAPQDQSSRDKPRDTPDDPRGDAGDDPTGGDPERPEPGRPTTEPGGPLSPAGT